MKKIVAALTNDISISALVGKDKNGISSIRCAKIPTGSVLPQITIDDEELNSEPEFTATHSLLNITVWIDSKETKPVHSFLMDISDKIIALFNREGGKYNEIDVTTNTGVRVCNILKTSRTIDYDEILKYNYVEIIFEVVRSEDESFATTDAGDKAWT